MNVIIAGSRSVNDYVLLLDTLKRFKYVNYTKTVVSGGAKGVDQLGERFAREFKLNLVQYKPDWTQFGKQAGILRNIKMVDFADALIAIWDGKSRGTEQIIRYAKKRNKMVIVYNIKKEEYFEYNIK